MRIRKRVVILFLLIGGFVAYKLCTKNKAETTEVPDDKMYIFPELNGPQATSHVKPEQPTSWKKYGSGPNYGIGILLTDTNSSWLGIVHAFKSFGIPFKIHTDAASALRHRVVLVYPIISGKACRENEFRLMDEFLRNSGVIIGINVLGGITEDFGFTEAIPSRKNFKAVLNDTNSDVLKEFTDPKERVISLGDKSTFKEIIGTYSFTKPALIPLLSYENREACMTQYYFKGGGKAFALGIDLGEFILRSENERGFNAQRTYVNDYEPTLDVLIRIIRNIYTQNATDAVLLNTVPGNKSITVCITHDIDFTRSIKNAVDYAKMEKEKNIPATYFIQTKYIRDWNDDIFFNKKGVEYLNTIASLGMEIASHSVAHSHAYSKFPAGDGNEQYPGYRPFVKGRDEASGGTVLGELRVSKFLLESCVKNTQVVSFRPGHLSYPFSLPQSLLATGYQYSSGITANNALTHLPYQLQYNRSTTEELDAFEFPVTIEDEEKPRMDLRIKNALSLAKKLSRYGGLMNVLIHTDTIAYKFDFEKQLIDSLNKTANFMTIKDFGNWWKTRNGITFYIEEQTSFPVLHVKTKTPIKEIGFTLPTGYTHETKDKNIEVSGNTLLIHELKNEIAIILAKVK